MAFRIRRPPKKPKKKKGIEFLVGDVSDYVGHEVTLGEFFEKINKAIEDNILDGYIPKEGDIVIREREYSSFYGDNFETKLSVLYKYDEEEEEWQKRLQRYKQDLQRYNEWYRVNKDKIKEEIKRRERRDLERKKKKLERLKRAAESLEKELES